MSYLGKYNLTTCPGKPCIRYVQEVCGGYQCATERNIPSESPDFFRVSAVSSQSQVPTFEPGAST